MFIKLAEIAKATLGYKSLQNNFFYIGKDTIATYGIESQYLKPLFMLRDLNATSYLQAPTPKLWLLHCQAEERDLRGTGAYRYIQTMADRAAANRKQSGAVSTIRNALEKQGGGLWYAPKALPHRRRLWLRKAFDGVYAPFIFSRAALVDQRCNAIAPVGVPQDSLAAVLTSTLFAYSLEINGSAGMGAGALEAPTTRLRSYPVFDVRRLSSTEHAELQLFAKAVWQQEAPLDWTDDPQPGERLRKLDAWLLARAGSPVALEVLYRDLRATCEARIAVAGDKTRTTKKHKIENISSVAKSISETIRRLLEARRFPEDFCRAAGGRDDVLISLPAGLLRRIEVRQFMATAELWLMGDGSQPLFHAVLDFHVAEAIVQALLAGRESFAVSTEIGVAEAGVSDFINWFSTIKEKLREGIALSSLGTGYESRLSVEVYRLLGLHPLVAEKNLPQVISISQ
jgi:hypothetical protein